MSVDNTKKVLIACSGGPDSMALLDMYKDVAVCGHVNYHHRYSANRDENIVRSFCLEHNIPFYKADFIDDGDGNFQARARVFRYQFFADLVASLDLGAVYVAHHQDDLLETYLLQKRRGLVEYYGLKRRCRLFGVLVVRPLLNYSKNDLLNYCEINGLEYGIDESNLSDLYVRNQIRHHVLSSYSDDDRKKLLIEIKQTNKEIRERKSRALAFIKGREKIPLGEFLGYQDSLFLLVNFLRQPLGKKRVADLMKQIRDSRGFRVLVNDYYLVKEYDYVMCFKKERDYCFKFNSLKECQHKHFKLAFSGSSLNGVYVREDDFPLMVRNAREGDFIVMRFGKKKLNRFFIDHKFDYKRRLSYPVLVNKNGEVILLPGLGCDWQHYNTHYNLFMIE